MRGREREGEKEPAFGNELLSTAPMQAMVMVFTAVNVISKSCECFCMWWVYKEITKKNCVMVVSFLLRSSWKAWGHKWHQVVVSTE